MSPAPLAVLFDARTLRPGMTGVGRYSFNLLKALQARPDVHVRAIAMETTIPLLEQYGGLQGVEWVKAPVSHERHPGNELWLWRGIRKIIRPEEIYHGPALITPPGEQPFRRVVTVHDLFVFDDPEFYPLKFRFWLRSMMRSACRRCERIIVPSRPVASGLVRLGLAPRERIAVCHEAPDRTPAALDTAVDADRLEMALHWEGPLLVSVGTLDPRKDPTTARQACVQLAKELGRPIRWLWLGGRGAKRDPTPSALCKAADAAGFVAVGAVSSAGVQQALARAAFYISCSRAEGFGLPLVEALRQGCPIVASDLAVHREVCGDAAQYFPPGNVDALVKLVRKGMKNKNGSDARRATARVRGKRYSWKRVAEETIAIYREARKSD